MRGKKGCPNKNYLKIDQILNLRTKIIQLLKENLGENLLDLRLQIEFIKHNKMG